MKSALKVQKVTSNSSLPNRASRNRQNPCDEVHLLAAMQQIADPTIRYAVSMLADCLVADITLEDRMAGVNTYFQLICSRLAHQRNVDNGPSIPVLQNPR